MFFACRKNRLRRWVTIFILINFMSLFIPGIGIKQVQASSRDDLITATDNYSFGEYEKAKKMLSERIDAGQIDGALLLEFLELRARCYINLGQESLAADDFCRVHRMDESWYPDSVNYTQNEIQAFEKGIESCEQVVETTTQVAEPIEIAIEEKNGKPFYAKPMVWVATVAVAGAGVLAAVFLGGGDEEESEEVPLGGFPEPPIR